MKVNATISYGNVGREMFTLGNEHMSQWAQVSYDDIVEVCGFKPMMRENGLTLVAYGGMEVTIKVTDNSDIPTPEGDLLKLSVLEVAKGGEDLWRFAFKQTRNKIILHYLTLPNAPPAPPFPGLP